MLCGLVQMCSSDDPAENLINARASVIEAADNGATFVLTPEVTNCISTSRRRQNEVLQLEHEDRVLAGLRETAAEKGIWLLIGSLALKSGDADGRFVNRSFLIAADGSIAARYDKVHMFDVTLSETESYRESDGYKPGDTSVLAETPFGEIGMTICYDLRFPYLYRSLAQKGAKLLTIPSAFARLTGQAHWEILLRARAIETGCFVLAPAQTGEHKAVAGKIRKTWGHSMIVSPWGEVLLDLANLPRVGLVKINIELVNVARGRIPSVLQDAIIRNL